MAGGCYEPFFSASGVDALRTIRSGERFEIALIDVSIPNISSVVLVDEYIWNNPHGKIVIMSGYHCPDAFKGLDFLKKPFMQDNLVGILKRNSPV